MTTTLRGPHLKPWYPALAAKLGDTEFEELARLLAEVKKDTLEEAKRIAVREAGR